MSEREFQEAYHDYRELDPAKAIADDPACMDIVRNPGVARGEW